MGIHRISVNRLAFDNIIKNRKRIEGRLKRGYFQKNILNKNDIIIFINKEDQCLVRITDIIEYINAQEYLENEILDNIIPDISSISDALKHYAKFYSKKKLENTIMIAIRFNLVLSV